MRVLSGMQPSGAAHLGNYFGAIKPNIELLDSKAEENLFIIVDLHALTTVKNAEDLRSYRMNVAKAMLACGFDSSKGHLFFQSDVLEHTELAWILSCITPMGLLERAVSYKDKVEKGLEASVGLFTYPALQAADILLYNADVVPVGKDQKQHLEMARDIAQKFNNRYGVDILTLPEPQIRDDVAVVPGVDGQKMSKSYGNTLPIFEDESVLKKAIMGIVTDSKGVDEPKDPNECIVYKIHALLLSDAEKAALAEKYQAGGLGYGDAKKMLLEAFLDYFGPMRAAHVKLDDADVAATVEAGAKQAKTLAQETMQKVRTAVGLR